MTINFIIKKIQKYLSRKGFGKGKKYKVDNPAFQNLNLEKLHVGCGNVHLNDWCNVDVLATGSTDLVCDITTLKDLPNSCVSQIYSCHVLEHFSTSMISEILINWYRVLKPGAELRISVPDLDAITKIYQTNLDHFQIPGHQPWIALIYGGQKDQYDFHKTGFNYCWLKFILNEVGFVDVKRYENEPHFIEGVIDNSIAKSFGEYISLNVVAIKPKI
jgi:predicted SAM-dependent methyltransferase